VDRKKLNRRTGPRTDHAGHGKPAVRVARMPCGPVAAQGLAWPPPPINDFWPTQTMRDLIIDGYGEDAIHSYWYLSSVMDHWRDDQEGFSTSSREVGEVMARLRDLAGARAGRQAGQIDATVIVPVYNNILDTLLCLVTVLESAGDRSFEVIVADDGSKDATGRLIPTIGGNVIYHRQPENLGFLRNCNAAARLGAGRYVVLLNNDTLVLPGWLDALLGRVDKGDSQAGQYLIQGGFWGGHLDPGFDERRGMGVS